jgi:hypothetical protein
VSLYEQELLEKITKLETQIEKLETQIEKLNKCIKLFNEDFEKRTLTYGWHSLMYNTFKKILNNND